MSTTDKKIFVKKTLSDNWEDINTKFDGVCVLGLSGMDEIGDTVNVYDEQWINSDVEDFHVVGGRMIRKNVDITLTFIVGKRYATNPSMDVQMMHDFFVDYICNTDGFYIRNEHIKKTAHVACLKAYKPTTSHVRRLRDGTDEENSYIMGSVTLHTLEKITT